MAVGEGKLPEFNSVKGVQIGVASAGIKKPGKKDLVIFEFNPDAVTAGVFTRNQFCAAPVVLSKKHLSEASPRFFVINTGNANAGTGSRGMADALATCEALARATGVSANEILPFSTGVIGEPLPVEKICQAIPGALDQLGEANWVAAAEGIMTTDTRPKGATRTLDIDGRTVAISGISKGAGMICPNMATMLAYIVTDAGVSQAALQRLLSRCADQSFNRVTVDGDTSTNDSCMLTATGASGVQLEEGTTDFEAFAQAVADVLLELAQAIVKDGEGATKFVEVQVQEADTTDSALKVAYGIAHSPLVKTALFASDPNWGRILAVVGRAGVAALNLDRVNIWLNDVCIVEAGARAASYTEAAGQAAMAPENIVIRIALGIGDVKETVWTTDFSHDYVTINAEYRT